MDISGVFRLANETFDKSPVVDLAMEALDFRVASESFAKRDRFTKTEAWWPVAVRERDDRSRSTVSLQPAVLVVFSCGKAGLLED